MVTDMRLPKRFKDVSIYRGSREITIYKLFEAPPSINFTSKIEVSIGGVMGFGSTKSVTEVWVTQN